jgi:phospholipid transport system substrate-binding protein
MTRRWPKPNSNTRRAATDAMALCNLVLGSTLATLVAMGIAPTNGHAAMGPIETLRDRDRRIREMLTMTDRNPASDRDAQLRRLVNGIFDYELHARESFGRYWDHMSEAERKEAIRLITTLLEQSSMEKVHEYRSNRIRYVSEKFDPDDPASATVVTRVAREREEWEIAYRLRQSAGRWRIVDVVVEGASTLENNRAAFYREIRATGVKGLLDKLRRKVEQTNR